MGKAARRNKTVEKLTIAPEDVPAPFVARPFEGLPGETDLVAMREIVPSATAGVRYVGQDGAEGAAAEPREVTICTLLPMTWPALHRADGTILLACQTAASSGDGSRDMALALLAALETEPGQPVTSIPRATVGTPRLQDLLDLDAGFEVQVHDGFDYWVDPSVELDEEGQQSLKAAGDSAMPTVKLATVDSAYWVRMGDRTYIRFLLPYDEDAATTALARLKAAGEHTLGEGTALLGAFRAAGLLVPVFEVPAEAEPEAYADALSSFADRLDAAMQEDVALTPDQQRARDGLVSRQVTLR